MGSHQAIIRLLGSIISCAILCSVWAAPNYHRRYENMQRSLRHPWYRNTDESNAEKDCLYWKRYIQGGYFLRPNSEYGSFCLKMQANVRVLTWCKPNEGLYERLYVSATVLDTRETNILHCEIYEVTLIGRYGYPENYCKIIQLNGVLWCVDMDSTINGEEIFFYTPEFFGDVNKPSAEYTICGNSMEQPCSKPLLVQTIQPREVSIALGGCHGAHSAC